MGNRFPWMTFAVLGSLLLLSSMGCTQIDYRSKGYIPVYLSERPHHKHKIVLKGVKEFYLWGKIRHDHSVDIDEEFFGNGFLSISELQTSQYQTLSQFLTSFFSLGFYIPLTYRLSAQGAMDGD